MNDLIFKRKDKNVLLITCISLKKINEKYYIIINCILDTLQANSQILPLDTWALLS